MDNIPYVRRLEWDVNVCVHNLLECLAREEWYNFLK